MLIDFDVFNLSDIFEFLYDTSAIQERIQEALEIINDPTINSKTQEI